MARRLGFAGLALLALNIGGASTALAAGPRPFQGRVVAAWDNVYAALPPSFGGIGLARFEGGGPVTHMGKTAQVGSLSLGDPVGLGVFPGSGTVTITAANGDSVTFDYVGFLDAGTGQGVGTFAFTGGTGRFAGATGQGTFFAEIDLTQPANQAMTVILDGTIIY
jgi:hypothetical protein